ncbi:MAG: polyprenyl synthetase family protein [Oscillospiraceae bacterium]|nr:polyprenyl synthetase family protein [Oscillospiraceae bacterium]MBQ4546797.1 polyprenyl synthetase family protein [Oscillospiraceae bacterium]
MSFLADDKNLIDSAMSTELVSASPEFDKIVEAMRYSALGGKRLRGILTLEFAKMFGCGSDDAMPYAVAVECIQAYSLIHDDLPCMDDDDMRRGKPSCHIAFGEANALLAGDALLTHAFSAISESDSAKNHPERAIKAVKILSGFAGFRGMVGGQVLDLEAAEKETDPETIFLIHKLKTGALIKASVLMGCAAAGADDELCKLSEKYASDFGFAFQIIDDILDFDGNYETCELNSYVKINGLEKAREDASAYIDDARKVLGFFAEKGFDITNFSKLLDFLVNRMK